MNELAGDGVDIQSTTEGIKELMHKYSSNKNE